MHKPVLLNEIVRLAVEINPARALDGTFGRGGHSRALLSAIPHLHLTVFDRDPEAISAALLLKEEILQSRAKSGLQVTGAGVEVMHSNFADFQPGTQDLYDFALLDLGVSSPQLDTPERGFSFYHDGPLDMRMDSTEKCPTAADVINKAPEQTLVRIFQDYGEIRSPYRVIRAVLHDRRTKPFQTTRDLAGLIERVEGWTKKGFHPATPFFMALRIYVNNELEDLGASLLKIIAGLRPEGRLAVMTFHSLEDRIVKNVFRENTQLGHPLFKKVVQPTDEETAENPRARSAKLRVFVRSDANSAPPGRRNRYRSDSARYSADDDTEL